MKYFVMIYSSTELSSTVASKPARKLKAVPREAIETAIIKMHHPYVQNHLYFRSNFLVSGRAESIKMLKKMFRAFKMTKPIRYQ